MANPHVLIVGPEAAELEATIHPELSGVACRTAKALEEALASGPPPDVVVVQETLEDAVPSELVGRLSRELEEVAWIVVHDALSSPELETLTAMGSISYFLKQPCRALELKQAIHRGGEAAALNRENARLSHELARAHQRLVRENRFLKGRAVGTEGFEGLLGGSPALARALGELQRLRHGDVTVHLHGETGTGKELVARALHFSGPRAKATFVPINCAGIPESLLQSMLFGHRRGAFTGADRHHAGVFVEANGGTLFLDEVAELPPSLQSALLRVLQQGEVMPVGGTQPVPVDVRVISATHQNLREAVAAGRFREDLYFRLVVVSVTLPPLREREGDVPLLARHFLALHRQRLGRATGELTDAALAALERYPWPGNARELENEMQRLVVLADAAAPIGPELLSPHLRGAAAPGRPAQQSLLIPDGLSYDAAIELLQRRLVEGALAETGGALGAAAARLEIERSRLGKLRTRLGVSG